MVVTRTTRNRFVLNRARGFESHHLRQKSQIQTNLRLFYFALLLLGTQKHRQKPGRRCPFSPKFSPTGTLTGRLLNLLKILLFVETAVSLHPLEYVTSAADTISVLNNRYYKHDAGETHETSRSLHRRRVQRQPRSRRLA